METCAKAVEDAAAFLRKHPGSPKILVKQIRNLGDTIHLTPVLRHYRLKYPNAAIAFVVGQWYHNVHEHNPHINGLFLGNHNATPQQRLALWPLIQNISGIDIKIIASIFPFGELHQQNKWCYETIADQYLYNAGIKDLHPLGGRTLEVKITQDDITFAERVMSRHDAPKIVVLEYHSYSKSPAWSSAQFQQLVGKLSNHGIKCVCIAASNEGIIPGAIDCRGITWRQTTAILSKAKAIVGVGSGITMLAAAAVPQPRIIELGISSAVSMKGCGYAPSISIANPTVDEVRRRIVEIA
jgi:ADP-heptose:LPS heptosyltransferase